MFSMFLFRCSTEIERDGIWEVHTLVIKDVSVDDGGDYHVKATNRVGTTEATGKLSIVTEEPSFPKTLESVTTKLGLTESFEVIFNNNNNKSNNMKSIKKFMPIVSNISYNILSTGYSPRKLLDNLNFYKYML
jgi:hypothetical protein